MARGIKWRSSTMSKPKNVSADYCYVGITLGRHPMSFLREKQFYKMRFTPSDLRACLSNRQLARGYGIATVRQRPETPKGVVFITIEDEAGNVNVICWSRLLEKQWREAMGAQLLDSET